MGVILTVAALWGFAEATLFFVVPDVLLTWICVRYGARLALQSALCTAVAAAAGGAVMWIAGSVNPAAVFQVLDHLPAISPAMFTDVQAAIAGDDWIAAMLAGAFSGTPYKVFATAAGDAPVALALFVAASIPVRLARFAVAIGLAWLLRSALSRLGRQNLALPVLGGFWVAFYLAFWTLMPN